MIRYNLSNTLNINFSPIKLPVKSTMHSVTWTVPAYIMKQYVKGNKFIPLINYEGYWAQCK